MPNPMLSPVLGFLSKLSFPRLFIVTATLFAIDLVLPDLIPVADELLLGLGTLLLANWRKRKEPNVIDAPPR
jgi:hypothetical protein